MSGSKNQYKKRKKFDIRKYKSSLRKKYKEFRRSIPPDIKKKKDSSIFQHILNSKLYKNSEMVLCYVSFKDEINTHDFINRAIKDGKIVGVPYCISGTRDMDFYKISSLDELEVRTYGVLEPVAKEENRLTDYKNSICIMPGLSFDKFGYRLGYGGGYYDRFLSGKFNGNAIIGVCYQKAVRYRLTHGYFDVPCDYVATENGMKPSIKNKKGGSKPIKNSKLNSGSR